MRRILLVLVVLLCPALAQAQFIWPGFGGGSGGSGTGGSGLPDATTGPLTYYVTATGSDTNPCTLALPCLTINTAVNKIPKRIRHLVTINVGVGNFAGAHLTGFLFEESTTSNRIIINGTPILATLAGGVNAGTATSGSNGDGGLTWGTLTSTGAGWTTNDLHGKVVAIVAGKRVGTSRTIVSNTADTVTITGNWGSSAPDATSQFEIRDWGTVINEGVLGPDGSYKAGVYIANNQPNRVNMSIYLSNLQFSGGSSVYTSAIWIHNAEVYMTLCKFDQNGVGILALQDAYVSLTTSVSYNTNTLLDSQGIVVKYLYISRVVADGGTAFSRMSPGNASISFNSLKNVGQAFSFFCFGEEASGAFQIYYNKLDGNGAVAIGTCASTLGAVGGNGMVLLQGNEIKNYGTTDAGGACVYVAGPWVVQVNSGSFTNCGTPGTTGVGAALKAENGARINYSDTTTFSTNGVDLAVGLKTASPLANVVTMSATELGTMTPRIVRTPLDGSWISNCNTTGCSYP